MSDFRQVEFKIFCAENGDEVPDDSGPVADRMPTVEFHQLKGADS